jgi:hypothetical protein
MSSEPSFLRCTIPVFLQVVDPFLARNPALHLFCGVAFLYMPTLFLLKAACMFFWVNATRLRPFMSVNLNLTGIVEHKTIRKLITAS